MRKKKKRGEVLATAWFFVGLGSLFAGVAGGMDQRDAPTKAAWIVMGLAGAVLAWTITTALDLLREIVDNTAGKE